MVSSLYVGFDLATACGMAMVQGDRYESYRGNFRPPMRYKHFRQWVRLSIWVMMEQMDKDNIHVAYEMPHARGRYATRVLIGMECMVIDVCEELGLEKPMDVHSGTLKKYFTGNGRADKAMMMAEATKRCGRPITDDNEADAIAVAMWLRDELEDDK